MSEFRYKICDPIHGFIRFGADEKQLIETLAFQRLRYLNQMGVSYLVYPGATHSRFEHSLGVMELASRIFRTLFPSKCAKGVRLAALCHDLGHLPFSHTAEETLLGRKGHENWSLEIVKSLDFPQKSEVLKILQGDGIISRIITDDNFGADRIDYLLRDAYYTGVRFGHLDYTHLIDSLRIIDEKIGVQIGGMQSVESLWIARYMMYARVYHHPKVRIFSELMRRFMNRHYEERGFPQTVEAYLKEKDYTILFALENSAHMEAKALLKGELLYRELFSPTTPEQRKKLQKTFADQVIIDIASQNCGTREFPVLTEREEVISSQEASPFLSTIPPGDFPIRLFALPEVVERVQNECLS